MPSFKCPECNGKKECGSLIIEPSMEFFELGKKPHQYETHFITCCDCHYYIPHGVAFHLNEQDYKKNQLRWLKDFKPYAETLEGFHEE